MEEQSPDESAATRRDIRQWAQFFLLVQAVVLIGILVVYLQVDGMPDRVAERVPGPNGNSADYGQVLQLQQSVDALSQQVQALQASIDRVLPSPTVPTVTPGPSGR